MNKNRDLSVLLSASAPLIIIETHEELRAVESFQTVLSSFWKPIYRWSVTQGFMRMDMDMPPAPNQDNDPQKALKKILETREKSVYLLLDFMPWLKDPVNLRMVKEICQQQHTAHSLVLISPKIDLPPGLMKTAVRYDLSLPDKESLEKMIREEAFAWSKQHDGRRVKVNRKSLEMLVFNLQGLTLKDARRLARNAIYQDGAIIDSDLPAVMQAKFDLLNQGGVLHFEYETAHFSDVAGLNKLKKWVKLRKVAFLNDKAPPGLDSPKGLMLLGVQGSGKSLAAKAVAGLYGLPLLRLDFATLYNKYHGETERNLRASLQAAEVMSPCVLWVDEIEKGISVQNEDGGTSKRILGTLLNWMSEHKSKVFLVSTANDISALPPELIRKGRMDEIFFVDLPDEPTRMEIFRIHLEKREQAVIEFDLKQLAQLSHNFSGAEIEQLVVSALYHAYALEEKLTDAHLLEAIEQTRPLAVTMSEQVSRLRAWGAERAVPAD